MKVFIEKLSSKNQLQLDGGAQMRGEGGEVAWGVILAAKTNIR